MTKSGAAKRPEPPLADKLVAMAPPVMQRRVSAIARGVKPDPLLVKDLGLWMRKCIQSQGALANSDLNEAAERLKLRPEQLSDARGAAGCVSYSLREWGKGVFKTDFAGRVPEEAFVARGAGKKKKDSSKNGPVVRSFVAPTAPPAPPAPKDPDEGGGRRLDQGDLTEAQHAEAERRMRESTERADREAAEIRARVDAGYATGSREVPVAAVEGENGNGKKKLTGLEAALELLVAEALAATHALTDDDIMMLRGTQENLKRMRSDIDGMAAGIGLLLKRVDQRQAEAAKA